MGKFDFICAEIPQLTDNELRSLGEFLLRFERRDILFNVIFEALFQVVHKNHSGMLSMLFRKTRTTFARLVCPFISIREFFGLFGSDVDFKAVINLRSLVWTNRHEDPEILCFLRAWLIQNISNLRDDTISHAKIYMSDAGSYLSSANLTKNGTRIKHEAGVFSSTTWYRDKAMAIFEEWWDSSKILTVEQIDETFRQLTGSEGKPFPLDINAVLADKSPAEYEATRNRLTTALRPVMTTDFSDVPNLRNKSPKSIFTDFFLKLLDAMKIRKTIPNIIEVYFGIFKWQNGEIEVPGELAGHYSKLVDAMASRRIELDGLQFNSTINLHISNSLLTEPIGVIDKWILYWQERPLQFIELLDKELVFRARRFVKMSRALAVIDEICTTNTMVTFHVLRNDIQVRQARPLQYRIMADPNLIPLANQIIAYQLDFLERLHHVINNKGSLFHNTGAVQNNFLVDFYHREPTEQMKAGLVVKASKMLQVSQISPWQAALICKYFSWEAISDENCIKVSRDLFEAHLIKHFKALRNHDEEDLNDLFAAFMGVESFETILYRCTTGKSL